MNKKSFTIGLLAALMSCVQSCNKDQFSSVSPTVANVRPPVITAEKTNLLQKTFAKLLAKTLAEEPTLRAFLKAEANKQFDGDDDILYHMVKDKSVDNGSTLRELLVRHDSQAELEVIEQQLPLLTIFIPTLPSGFSSQTWNTQAQIPVVAVCLRASNRVPIYDANGKEEFMELGTIPGFPTLLVKQNERIIATLADGATVEDSELNFHRNQQFSFSFVDKVFDNFHPKPSHRFTTVAGIDQRNIDAFNVNGADPNIQWQRDFVYYGITATSTRGPLNRNYSEFIRSLTYSADAYAVMSDQSEDPDFKTNILTLYSPAWTDGRFEIYIQVLTSTKTVAGPEFKRLISVRPELLFDVVYKKLASNYYQITGVTSKVFTPDIVIFPWDLDTFGNTWKFIFYERDATGVETYSSTNSSTFGANFEVNPLGGDKVKVGGKFGGSASTSSSTTHTITRNLGDDFLGEALLTFDRPVIRSQSGSFYVTNEITTGGQYGYVSASIEPLRY